MMMMIMLGYASCSTCAIVGNYLKMASLAGRHEMRVILDYIFMSFITESIYYFITVVVVFSNFYELVLDQLAVVGAWLRNVIWEWKLSSLS